MTPTRLRERLYFKLIKYTLYQGWARDVKARDRDETDTLTSRDRDETETLASPAETRPRRDVKISRLDQDEKLKFPDDTETRRL